MIPLKIKSQIHPPPNKPRDTRLVTIHITLWPTLGEGEDINPYRSKV